MSRNFLSLSENMCRNFYSPVGLFEAYAKKTVGIIEAIHFRNFGSPAVGETEVHRQFSPWNGGFFLNKGRGWPI